MAAAKRARSGSWRIPTDWEFESSTVKLHERLGDGSFGTVYRATRGGLEMAAKQLVVRGDMREEVEKVLRREFRAAHGLKHENIVKLLGVCVDHKDWVCLLMELVQRGSLRALLTSAPERVTGSEATQLKLADGIAAGMAYLHRRTPQMLHHDLKSENVLVGKDDVAKIADFGLATGTGGSTMLTNPRGAGTLAYKAPELFRRKPFTTACDVYAFGILAWELTTGEIPWKDYEKEDEASLMFAIVGGERPPLDPSQAAIFVGGLAQRCWAQEPDARPSFAEVQNECSAQLKKAPAIQQQLGKPVFSALSESVVAIGVSIDGAEPTRQFGTGFFVRADGHLITCHHVIWQMNSAEPSAAPRVYCVGVGSPIEWVYEAQVVRLSSCPGQNPQRDGDPMLDLAILRVTRRRDDAALPSFVPLTLADSDPADQGDWLWVIGYGQQTSDQTDTSNITFGILSGRHTDQHGPWIRTDAEILGGHSGGPVVNQTGEVIGWCVKSYYDNILTLSGTTAKGIYKNAAGGEVLAPMKQELGGLHALRPINAARPELAIALGDDFVAMEDVSAEFDALGAEALRSMNIGSPEVEALMCPITLSMLRDPVITSSGHTYEREAIVQHFRTDTAKLRNPINNAELENATLAIDWRIRRQVDEWLKKNPDEIPDGWESRDVSDRCTDEELKAVTKEIEDARRAARLEAERQRIEADARREAEAKAAEEAAAKAAEEAAAAEAWVPRGDRCPPGGDHQWVVYRGTRGSGKVCNNCYETRSNDNTPTWWFASRDEWQRVKNGGCPGGGGHEWVPHNPRAGYNPPWMCGKCGMTQDGARRTVLFPQCTGQWGPPVA